jgi:sulfate/thiosulfate-binding protein
MIIVKNTAHSRRADLLNVSYDPTRELYQQINARFSAHYQKETGKTVTIRQSHGGSSHQTRLVASGELQADVVTLGLPSDVEALHKHGLVADDWTARLPDRSRPYYSTIVFVVRRRNPHAIHDWPDLVNPGVEVITPDPKTSGNGKLTALAAWGADVRGEAARRTHVTICRIGLGSRDGRQFRCHRLSRIERSSLRRCRRFTAPMNCLAITPARTARVEPRSIPNRAPYIT